MEVLSPQKNNWGPQMANLHIDTFAKVRKSKKSANLRIFDLRNLSAGRPPFEINNDLLNLGQ